MRVLFETSGENQGLAVGDLRASLDAERVKHKILVVGERIVEAECGRFDIDAQAARLAMCHEIITSPASCKKIDARIAPNYARLLLEDKTARRALSSGSFAVRAKRIGEHAKGVDTSKIEAALGGEIAELTGAKVDLDNPKTEVRITLSDRCYIGICSKKIDRSVFDERKVRYRPFFSPVSLHPKLARVLVNLARCRRGRTVLDPFCGTGGVLIEATLIGARAVGSDIDLEMVDGAKTNLGHFRLPCKNVFASDVSKIGDFADEVDAIATDPPYGRSASTMKESVGSLYERAFRAFQGVLADEGHLSITLPDKKYIAIGKKYFKLKETYPDRVHRSLTRHFCVFAHR